MIVQGLLASYSVPTVTYATWNPSDKHADLTLSGGNLTVSSATNSWRSVRATIGKSSGKWYWEVTNNTSSNLYWVRGVALSGATLADMAGADSSGFGWYNDGVSSLKYNSNTSSAYGALSSTGDVIGFALDMDAGTIICYKNNVSQGTMYTSLTGTFYPIVSIYGAGPTMTANFGATTMTYTAPSGYNQGLYN